MKKLPLGWVWATLEDLGQWSSGGTPSRRDSKFYGGKIPWVKTGELHDGSVATVDEYLTAEGVASSAAKVFPAGSLVVAIIAHAGRECLSGTPRNRRRERAS